MTLSETNSSLRVLALDPGERVGWARADVDPAGNWSDMRHGITPLRDMALSMNRALVRVPEHGPSYDLVIIEDWRLYPHMAQSMVGSSFPSVQFIGMVKLCCWLSGTKLVTQGASIKSTADKTMKVLRPELYEIVTRPVAHDAGHDQDALRHLFFWTYRNTSVGSTPLEGEAA
jgi:hypothetical protein